MQRKTVIKQEEVAIEIGKREKIISAIAEGSGTVDQAGAENVVSRLCVLGPPALRLRAGTCRAACARAYALWLPLREGGPAVSRRYRRAPCASAIHMMVWKQIITELVRAESSGEKFKCGAVLKRAACRYVMREARSGVIGNTYYCTHASRASGVCAS